MASLADLYAPGPNPAAAQADYSLQAGLATSDAGLALNRLNRNYSERQLPSLVNMNAARGTFYGGQIGVQGDQLKQDVGDASGDIWLQLSKQLANLRRSGVLAATGISI